MTCDFCNGGDPGWFYPAESFKVSALLESEAGFRIEDLLGSDSGFMACEPCHALVEAEDRDGLINRSLDTNLLAHPEMIEDAPELRPVIAQMFEAFWNHRRGAGIQMRKRTHE